MQAFPATVLCPYGPHEQRVSRANNFPCLACGGVFRVDEAARVHAVRAPGEAAPRKADETQVSMEFPADPKLVSPLRRALRQVANGMGVRGSGLSDVELCFEEALMNIIIHGYAYDRTKPVQLETTLDKTSQRFTLTLKDQGRRMRGGWRVDRDQVRTRVRQRKVGGLGRFLIDELMDRVTLKRVGPWNVLTMERSLNPR